ncbi:MAG: TlpA disulfide reductase family protein [bacterium]
MSLRARRDLSACAGWWRLCAVLVLGVACSEPTPIRDGEERPEAPDFTLPTLDGRTLTLSEERGRIVIVDFWATWCPPCELQMPVLDALWEDERAQPREQPELSVIGVSVDTIASDEIERWVRERDLHYPIALGDQELARKFGVIGFPTLFVIDPEGRIHTRHTGVLDRPSLEEIIEQIRIETRADASPEGLGPEG